MTRSASCAVMGCTQLLAVGLALAALFAPTYHFEGLTIMGGQLLNFDVSLHTVHVSSGCVPIWYGNPFFQRTANSVDATSCRQLVATLNGQTLKSLTGILCGVEFGGFQLPSTGCNEFTNLTFASGLLMLFNSLQIVCQSIAFMLIVLFFVKSPFMVTRKGILVLQTISFIWIAIGMFLYVMVGGVLRPQLFVGDLFGGSELHSVHFSYGGGFAVAVFNLCWTAVQPSWAMYALKLKYCKDYDGHLEEDEVGKLLQDIDMEAGKLPPHVRQRYYEDSAQAPAIIDWFWSQGGR